MAFCPWLIPAGKLVSAHHAQRHTLHGGCVLPIWCVAALPAMGGGGHGRTRGLTALHPIPVTRVSNGQGGWADLILTKDKRPPSLCRQCTAVVFLGLTNTCCNRNGPSTSSRIELLSELTNSVQTSHLWENGIPMLATCK